MNKSKKMLWSSFEKSGKIKDYLAYLEAYPDFYELEAADEYGAENGNEDSKGNSAEGGGISRER